MLLNIYLGSIAISFSVTSIFEFACRKRFKREGYKSVYGKASFVEKFANLLSDLFICSIPGLNIIRTIYFLFRGYGEIYESLTKELLLDGKIYKPMEEKIDDNSKRKILEKEKFNNYTEISKKTYDEMTIEEKLEYLQQEKEKLINQSTIQTEKLLKKSKK